MKSSVFGLDIGTTTTRVVWLSKEEKGYYSLESALSVPTPAKGMSSESPIDKDEMIHAIKGLVSDAKIYTKKANVALSENQVYTKVINMPFLSDKELSSAIYWEAEQYIPIPLADITLDYRVLKMPKKAEDTQMPVLLVGAANRLIEKYTRILFSSGLTVGAIETEVLAVARALINEVNFPPTLIVNFGTMSTSLSIVKDGIITFVYSVATGGLAISRAIATEFNFSLSQAEEYKKVYGIADNSFGGKIIEAMNPILLSLISEIKKALTFYNQNHQESPVAQIILSGATAKLPGLDVFVANNIGIETIIANPWKVLNNQQLPKEIIEAAPEYTVAVGLAMRDYE